MPFDLLPYLQAIKQAAPPSYLYNEHLARYQDARTGRIVAAKTIFKLLNSNETVTVAVLDNLSQALASQTLDLSAWMLAMQQQLSRLHVQAAALGAGGFERLKTHDFARITHALQADWPRLAVFGQEIVAGNLSRKQIASRVVMYAGHARTQYYAAKTKPATKPGYVLLERRIIKAGDNCTWCVHLANLGWQPVDTLPLPGESGSDWQDGQCLTNCRCDLERKAFSRAEANALTGKAAPFFATDYSYRNIIKGGEGSGYTAAAGHAGRPGQRGGSKPTRRAAQPLTAPDANAPVFAAEKEFADHPLTRLFLSQDVKILKDGSIQATMEAASKRKKRLVERIAKELNLPEADVNRFIAQWAETSNNGSVGALVAQKVASDLFGIPLSEWQQAKLDRTLKNRQSVLDGFLHDRERRGETYKQTMFAAVQSMQDYPMAGSLWQRLKDDLNAGLEITSDQQARDWVNQIDQIDQEGMAKTKKVLAYIYARTQNAFKVAGITHVTAYRGVKLPHAAVKGLNAGDLLTHTMNAMSSWSVNKYSADAGFVQLSQMTIEDNKFSSIGIQSVVPVDRIVSYPGTGFGCLGEWEIVVLGSNKTDTAQIYEIQGTKYDKLKKSIKGGPGSGFHRHRGRPGERGGSAPSGRLILPDDADSATPSPFEASPAFATHPLMKLFVGENPTFTESGSISFYAVDVVKKREDALIRKLAKHLGVANGAVNDYMETWADSSNDKHLTSLSIQADAAEMFDVPLSDWQMKKVQEAIANRQSMIDQAFEQAERYGDTPDEAMDVLLSSLNDRHRYPFEYDLQKLLKAERKQGLVIKSKADAEAWLDNTAREGKAVGKKALAYIYAQTQAAFQAAGITHVAAYRATQAKEAVFADLDAGQIYEHTSNALSSWSLSKKTVDTIFLTPWKDGDSAIGLQNVVPVERIVSMAPTGFGSLGEWEIVVMGSKQPEQSFIYEVRKGKKWHK